MDATDRALKKRLKAEWSWSYQHQAMIWEIVPKLEQGVNEIRSATALESVALPEIEKSLAQIADMVKALKEAIALQAEGTGIIEAATGHLAEEGEGAKHHYHELGSLATLIQYYKVAGKSSPEFLTVLLNEVDEQAFLQAWGKIEPQKRNSLMGIADTLKEG